jgi:hypothetical protein
VPNLVNSQTFNHHPDTNPGAPAHGTGPRWARGQNDDLMLPNGSVVGQTDNETLRRLFAGLGIADSWTLGRDRLIAQYVAMLKKIFDDTAEDRERFKAEVKALLPISADGSIQYDVGTVAVKGHVPN